MFISRQRYSLFPRGQRYLQATATLTAQRHETCTSTTPAHHEPPRLLVDTFDKQSINLQGWQTATPNTKNNTRQDATDSQQYRIDLSCSCKGVLKVPKLRRITRTTYGRSASETRTARARTSTDSSYDRKQYGSYDRKQFGSYRYRYTIFFPNSIHSSTAPLSHNCY